MDYYHARCQTHTLLRQVTPTKLIPRLQSNYKGTMADHIYTFVSVLQVRRVMKNRYTYAIVQV